jgi:hypothetical protein
MNSGQPVALLMTVKACSFSIVPFLGIADELYFTSHGPMRSTYTSSQGLTLAFSGKGSLPYFLTNKNTFISLNFNVLHLIFFY